MKKKRKQSWLHETFIDAIGVVYDWNALFHGFPGSVLTNAYRANRAKTLSVSTAALLF